MGNYRVCASYASHAKARSCQYGPEETQERKERVDADPFYVSIRFVSKLIEGSIFLFRIAQREQLKTP